MPEKFPWFSTIALADRVQQSINVRHALRIACLRELVRRIDCHKHDCREHGDDADDDQDFDKREPAGTGAPLGNGLRDSSCVHVKKEN